MGPPPPISRRGAFAGPRKVATEDNESLNKSIGEAILWTAAGPLEIRRPDGSAFHKYLEAWKAGDVIFMPGSAETSHERARTHQIMEMIVEGRPQIFLVEHDWAAVIGPDTNLKSVEYRLPFDHVVLEFNISGKRVIRVENEGLGALVAIFGGSRWVAFIVLDSRQPPPVDRARSLLAVFQLTADATKALSIVMESGLATADLVPAAPALNKARERSGKILMADYHVIRVEAHSRSPVSDSDSESMTRMRHRLHFRRGHHRKLGDRSVWVRWTLAGNPDLGFVEKYYRA